MKAKRLIAMLLCAIMLFSLLPAAAFAEEDEEIIEVAFGAEETEEILPEETNAEEPAKEDSSTEENGETQPLPGDGELSADEEAGEEELPAEEKIITGEPETKENENEFDADIASGMCGVGAEWTIDQYGELEIYGFGKMYDYPSDYPDYYNYRDKVKFIQVLNPIESIGSYAFYGMNSFTEIFISGSVKSIGAMAFYGCSALKTIRFTGDAPSSISESALKGITATVRFDSSCKGWENIVGKSYGGDITWVADDSKCGGNISWSIDSIGTLSLKGTGAMYDYSSAEPGYLKFNKVINYIEVGEGISSLGAFAFRNLTEASEVKLPVSLTVIGRGAFSYCTGLFSITIPWKVSSIQDYAFNSCSGLRFIWFSGDAPSISGTAFTNVDATAKYPAGNATWTSAKKQNYGGALHWMDMPAQSGKCGSNAQWTIADNVLIIYGSGRMYDYSDYNEAPWWFTVTGEDDDGKEITYIESYSISAIRFEGQISYIGANAFSQLAYLESVDFKNSSSTITEIGEGAFEGCSSLKSIVLPVSLLTVGANAFKSCIHLKDVTPLTNSSNIGAYKISNIFDRAFADTAIVNAYIPASVKYVSAASFRTDVLKAYTVMSGNEKYKAAGGVLFDISGTTLVAYPCAKGSEYTVPEGVKIIDSNCFERSKIAKLTLPSTLTTVCEDAFSYCMQLKELTIPASVTEIECWAFSGVNMTVYFTGNAPFFGAGIYDHVFANAKITAFIPAGNKTWTSDVMQQYGGSITWRSYKPETPVKHDAPVINTVANHADYMIVTWNKVDGATSYQLAYREGSGAWQSMDVTLLMVDSKGNPRVNLKNLKQGANYTFIAYALFADGSKTKSASATQTRLLTPNVQVKAGSGYVNLTWNEVQGGSQYKIYYREKGGSWQLYAWVKKGVTSINIKESVINANGQTPLIKGHTYEFAVILGTSVAGITSGFPTTPVSVKY